MSDRVRWIILAAGDFVTIVVVTIYGFATHGTLLSAGIRLPATFFPILIAWFITAPVLGAYDLQRVKPWRELWRPFYAMVLASTLAAVLRGLMLNSPIIPIFVVVLGGVSALAILLWRLLHRLIFMRVDRNG